MSVIVMSLNFYLEQITSYSSIVFESQEAMKYPSNIYSGIPILMRIFFYTFSCLVTLPTVLLITKKISVQYIFGYIILGDCYDIFSSIFWEHSSVVTFRLIVVKIEK